jgi:hypothetical protein
VLHAQYICGGLAVGLKSHRVAKSRQRQLIAHGRKS